MTEDNIKRILCDMEKQGFPLEVKATEVLKAHGWEVTNQVTYRDMESGKSRTLDILAEKNVIYDHSKFCLDVWLFVECKKATKPWIFYASGLDLTKEESRRRVVSSTQFVINHLASKKGKFEELSNLVIGKFLLQNIYPRSIFKKLATNSFEPFTEGKGRSIHKARMQVCNAILDMERNLNADFFSEFGFPYYILFVPMIIVEGQVYAYDNGQLSIAEGLYYHVSYHRSSFIIEVVTAKSFEPCLTNMEQIIANFRAQEHYE